MLDPGAFIGLGLISILYLFLCVVVVLRSRTTEVRLLGLGLITAVTAVCFGSLTGAVNIHASGGGAGGFSAGVSLSDLSSSFMKIAVILVLGSIAVHLWPSSPERQGGI